MKTTFDPRTRVGRLMLAFVAALMLAIAALPRPPAAEREAYRQGVAAAEALEEATVEGCRASLKFEYPRAKPGLTRVARALPDGSFLAVVPFKVGAVTREARCIGRRDGSLEFGVQVATL